MSDLIAPVKVLRWDTGTLTWVVWDGSLTTGSLVIGAVTQSGTWTVQPGNTANTTAWKVDGSAVTQPISAVSLPLPSGAATETTLATRLADATFTGRINTQGQKTMAASTPIVIASDQSAITANSATSAGKTITYVSVNQSVAGTTTLASASVGNKHKVLGSILTLSAAGTLKLDDTVGDIMGPLDIAANGGFVVSLSTFPFTETAATNRALRLITTSGAARGVVAILTEP